MDAALSSDRAYFDADGRLIFFFSTTVSAPIRAVAGGEDAVGDILVGRQSPVAAVLAALAVLTFGFVSAQSALFSDATIALAESVQSTSLGFGSVASVTLANVAGNISAARSRMWGDSERSKMLPFGGLSQLASTGSSPSISATQELNSGSLAAVAMASIASVSFRPAHMIAAVSLGYQMLGARVYGSMVAIMQSYQHAVYVLGARAYGWGGVAREMLAALPQQMTQGLQFVGTVVIAGTHLAIETETSFVYRFVAVSPRVAQALVLSVGESGAFLERHVAFDAPRVFAWAVHEPSVAAPALARAVVGGVYEGADNFVQATLAVRTVYVQTITRTGNALYASAAAVEAFRRVPIGERVYAVSENLQQAYTASVLRGADMVSTVFRGPRGVGAFGQ